MILRFSKLERLNNITRDLFIRYVFDITRVIIIIGIILYLLTDIKPIVLLTTILSIVVILGVTIMLFIWFYNIFGIPLDPTNPDAENYTVNKYGFYEVPYLVFFPRIIDNSLVIFETIKILYWLRPVVFREPILVFKGFKLIKDQK